VWTIWSEFKRFSRRLKPAIILLWLFFVGLSFPDSLIVTAVLVDHVGALRLATNPIGAAFCHERQHLAFATEWARNRFNH
jgi:hypothetical protein